MKAGRQQVAAPEIALVRLILQSDARAVRDGRLYRETHGTFEDYCRERWEISRQYGDRLIAAYGVVQDLKPLGSVPTTQAQARPLAPLAPEQRVEAWQEAVASEQLGGEETQSGESPGEFLTAQPCSAIFPPHA